MDDKGQMDNRIKILFLIHDLGHGGAEKVLVNLVNNMDRSKFDISVTTLFGGGVNEQSLKPDIRYHAILPKEFHGNSHFMKLLTPRQLHKLFIKETYDIEVAYLEGPSARIISGCRNRKTKLVSWIHCTMRQKSEISIGFRNYREACSCYRRMDMICFVSYGVRDSFLDLCPGVKNTKILYNTNESDKIVQIKHAAVPAELFSAEEFSICGVGKVVPVKGFNRLAHIHKRLRDEKYPVHCYILGVGSDQTIIQTYIDENGLGDSFTFLGYQTNPYKYVSRCDLFVCASFSEGFSTAATEALIVGTPVCTVEVSGMKEMLGENNEYGIVTENSEEALYEGIKRLLDDPALLAHYRKQAALRGERFSTEKTVKAVEDMLLGL